MAANFWPKMTKNGVLNQDSNLHLPESKKMSENQTKALPLCHGGRCIICSLLSEKINMQLNLA